MSARPDDRGVSTYHGGCHCAAVRFRMEAPVRLSASRCNCSICVKSGFQLALIVPARGFRLVRGEDDLISYRFGTQVANHLFCRYCGVKSFYVPRSNPDGYSVNVHCLDGVEPGAVPVEDFDGQHWEAHAHKLAHLSR